MEDESRARELADLTEKVQIEVGKIFDSSNDSKQRADILIEKVQSGLDVYSELGLISTDVVAEIQTGLRSCSEIAQRDEFISRVTELIKPLVELRLNHPAEIEQAQRKLFVEDGAFIPLNEILSYGVSSEGIVHIHLAPARTLKPGEIISSVKSGLAELAEIVRADEKIKEIVATSWIVARAPKIFKNFGFTVEGKIDSDMRAKHFPDEERPVSRAVMSRDEFLTKY